MLAIAANFPDAVVGIVPVRFEEFEQHALERPRLDVLFEPGGTRERQRIDHFSIHVELKLRRGLVADSHRLRPAKSRQPRQLQLRKLPFAADAVEHLQILRTARRRAQQPFAPCACFVAIAGQQQRIQRERRIAKPAVAIVPVAHAAELFRQRCRRRSDDAARGRVRHRLQHDE